MLLQAKEALRNGDGQTALSLADRILDEDETNWEAWYVAMQCFQLIYPIDAYDAANELECARCAIRYAPREQKYRVRKLVHTFLLDKVLAVLERDGQVLSDGRELLGFYQRTAYFDATGAPAKTREKDEPVLAAVRRSFDYCLALFETIPDSALRRSAALNAKAAAVADQWQRTVSLLALRMGLYRHELTREQVQQALQVYGRYLRAVKNKEAIMAKTVAFNTLHEPQLNWLQ